MSTKRLTTEMFITRSQEIHKDKFTYENTIYKNMKSKVITEHLILF